MKSSIIKTISSGLVALMAITSGCSKSQVPEEDQATADGQAGGGGGGGGGAAGSNRLGSSAMLLEAVNLPDGLRMRLLDMPENEARRTVSKIVSELPEKSTYAGSFKVNGTGTLNEKKLSSHLEKVNSNCDFRMPRN